MLAHNFFSAVRAALKIDPISSLVNTSKVGVAFTRSFVFLTYISDSPFVAGKEIPISSGV
jgi:hypothetical protein